MAGKVVLEVDMGKYKYVELELSEAEKLIREVVGLLGFESQDANEAFRVLRNFDAFYDMARKKFKDYIVPSKSMNDMILGRVIIDKLRLVKEGDKRVVGVYFDRRVPEEVIVKALEKLGYEVEVKRLELV
ncbi:MAG: hypothetical protein F7B17_07465 [Desulfurococcales archaeon]|nr:hypothetical protein [Desulfurococcales archaeon]